MSMVFLELAFVIYDDYHKRDHWGSMIEFLSFVINADELVH